MWVGKNKKGKTQIFERDCGLDLVEALRIRDLLIAGEKRNVTLRCKNLGFPPPEKFLPYEDHEIVRRRVKGKVKKFKRTFTVNPLSELNLKGIYWCPYCMKLRRFVHRAGFWVDDKIWVDKNGLYCPMCDVAYDNHHVRKWNPHVPHG